MNRRDFIRTTSVAGVGLAMDYLTLPVQEIHKPKRRLYWVVESIYRRLVQMAAYRRSRTG